jgi:voltage-dependent potassium channel beta subunit
MEYRRMGDTGLKISSVSLGAWITYGGTVEEETAIECLHTAIENGINFIDVADVYAGGRAEEVVGRALKDHKRSDLVISSKVFWPMSENVNDRGLSRKHILESVDKSLARLDLDYLDLYFCHRYDTETPVEEVVRAMDDLVHQGKVLYWGTSVWSAAQLEDAVGTARRCNCYAPKVEQPRYNMLDRHIEPEILPVAAKQGIGIVVWSPLAEGVLTGKYNDGIPEGARGAQNDRKEQWAKEVLTEENRAKLRALCDVANELGVSMSQLALAWCLRRPEVTSVITGATRPQQVLDNVKAADIHLSDDVQAQIEGILANAPAA